ncbi:VOC family protein [Streptomyces sp. NPDC005355]|uniref:VOC family protein n=1 Tax=unclassified Streptomyces TaxID=2593676 RepID=UPI0033B9D4BC
MSRVRTRVTGVAWSATVLPPHAPAQYAAMLVLRVSDVDDATARLAIHRATIVADPQDRPEWGPSLRTAHLRTPDGTLVELQS